ncbi:MAG: sulfite exporter TauE/SafE family protein [Xanthobacteraceae bacterium]
MISDPIFYVAAVIGVVFLGLAKGGFSGAGLVATPLIALTVPPVQAAAIVLPILLVQDVISVWVYRRDWDAWNLKVLLPGAVIGIGAGGALAAYVSESYVRLALGLIACAFVLNVWFGAEHKVATRPSAFSGVFWGALAGFTSTISHAGAPPFQMHILPQRLDRIRLAATAAMFFAAVNAIKVVPFFLLGQFSAENLATSAVLFPFAIFTNITGIWLVRVMPTEWFYRITYFLVFLISLELIRGGVVGIWMG